MMKFLFAILFLTMLVSCEEYFVPEIDSQTSFFVFEGIITDKAGAQCVKVSKSVSYNNKSKFEMVSGFLIYIEGDNDFLFMLHEQQKGIYLSDSLAKGIIGVKYRMVAISPAGKTYYSSFEPLIAASPIDSISGVYNEKTILKYSEYEGYYEEIQPGVQVQCNLNAGTNAAYYRYEYQQVFQTKQIYPTVPTATTVYIARPGSSLYYDYISVVNSKLYSNSQVVDNAVSFVSNSIIEQKMVIDTVELDNNGNPLYEEDKIIYMQCGFIMLLKQYSLSEQGFAFWETIYNQVNSTGQIFDPIESQVKGNIYCNDDETELAFGYFGASAVTEKAVHLKLNNDNVVEVKPVHEFPQLSGTMTSFYAFDFWIY